MKSFTKYLLSMLKIGCIGFGGGSALIPVIEREMIGPDKLDNEKNYDKDIVVANLTPGALPVEIASSLGRRNFGYMGMILGALAMALPGAAVTVLLLTCLSSLRSRVGVVMDILTIIISAFIIYLILHYIKKIFVQAKNFSPKFFRRAILVMAGVFVLSCGKNLYKLFGFSGEPIFTLSTFSILVAAFLTIILVNIYRGWKSSKNKGKTEVRKNDEQKTDIHTVVKSIAASLSVWIFFLILFCIPALIISFKFDVISSFFYYIWRGCLSTLMSFGGGDAYLAVADGLFVESGIVSSESFYGDIISVANILPGSILCKALTAVGYTCGTNITGSTVAGITFAISGLGISIALSCGVFSVIYHLYDSLSSLKSMSTISHYIGPIISGLLGTVMLALLVQCKDAIISLIQLL